MNRQPLKERLRHARARRDKQAEKVAASNALLNEQQNTIRRLNDEARVADVVREVDLRKELDDALKKKAACIRQLEDENLRLGLSNDQVEKCEEQLNAAINEYVKAYTSDITEAKINAANLRAKATEIAEKGESEVLRLERLAAQILSTQHNGYYQISEDEARRQAEQYAKMVTRQRLAVAAEAKMIQERADRSLDSITENKAKALSRLKYEGGQEAVKRANEMIKNGGSL